MSVTVSATLAVNEALERRRAQGLPVLPLGFGEAGLPVLGSLRDALASGADRNPYGPVAGSDELRRAAAGYWDRRGLPTDPGLVVAGPGSKPLLYALLLTIGGVTAIAAPSWVSYAAQARLCGNEPLIVPAAPGEGGVPQPDLLAAAVIAARAEGRDVRAVVVTLPDNPTGTVASPETVRRLAATARELDLLVISDEIYRDLVHDDGTEVRSPAEFAPERTIVTTGLSKNLALGGWRIGAARLPDSDAGRRLRAGLLGAASEIWSSPSGPVQRAAAYAFDEPVEVTARIESSRRLHGAVVRAVAERFTAAGAVVAAPKAAFYLYPDFGRLRGHLASEHGVHTGPQLTRMLMDRYGLGVLAAAEFGEGEEVLRMRVATSLLYGDTEEQRIAALVSEDPASLPWVRAHLDRLDDVLESVTGAREPARPANAVLAGAG